MLLETENLTKAYHGKIVLRSFSAAFTPGIYGIIGNNGAGKSTLMNLLTDNLKRTDGKVCFDGTDILELGAGYRGNIGYMPQSFMGYASFTVRNFLYYIGQLKGISRKQIKSHVDDILKSVHLDRDASKKIEQLSGGMRQRVMLAQALLGNPGILMLDEPTAGLDPKERMALREFIRSISEGKIIFISTHIISDIEALADELVLLKAGVLVYKDTPAKLIDTVSEILKEHVSLEKACVYWMNEHG